MGYLYTDDKSTDPPKESTQVKGSDYKTCMPLSNVNTTWEYLKATDDSPFSKVLNYLNDQVEGLKGRLRRNRLLQTQDPALGIKAIAINIDEGLYNFNYEIRCSSDEHPDGDFSMSITNLSQFQRDNQTSRFTIKIFKYDKSGCGKDYSGILLFLDENPWIFSIVMIFMGIFLCFFGFKFVRWALAIVGGLTGFIVVLGVILWFWNYKAGSTA